MLACDEDAKNKVTTTHHIQSTKIQWQLDQEVGILYLIYRWLSAILFLAVLSCSLLDIGRTDEPRYEHHYAKWWIYLTHWGLMACAVQAWLGAWIVTQGMMVDRDDYGGFRNRVEMVA